MPSPLPRTGVAAREARALARRVLQRTISIGPRKARAVLAGVLVGGISGAVARSWRIGVAVVATCLGAGFAVVGAKAVHRERDLVRRALARLPLPGRPWAASYSERSPEVARLAERARRGLAHRALPELEALHTDPGRARARRLDAGLALVDHALAQGCPEQAVAVLERVVRLRRRLITDEMALRCETATLTGRTDVAAFTRRELRRLFRHPHLRFAAANLLPSTERIEVLSQTLSRRGFAPVALSPGRDPLLEHLVTTSPSARRGPLVSVIMPVFNGAETIAMAITSVLAQSWFDLEVIVVDDASTDDTVGVVEGVAARDSRVRLIRRNTNGGAYASRNRGLRAAGGEFVTVNDADDWAHPQKLQLQVEHLLEHPEVLANTSAMVRVTEDLRFLRRGHAFDDYVGINVSSLLVRRQVLDSIGGWDDVRVGADSELMARVAAFGGRGSVVHLERRTPLSLTLRRSSSLTRAAATGLGSQMHPQGVRRLYHLESSAWHRSEEFRSMLPLVRTSDFDPFFCPPPARRAAREPCSFDVVMLSDFGLPGGTTSSNLQELQAQKEAGLRTGLVHSRAAHLRDDGINPKFRRHFDAHARLVALGEEIQTPLVVAKYPPSFLELSRPFPAIHTARVAVVVNQAPWTSYRGSGRRCVYSIAQCDAELRDVFGVSPAWYPISPSIREALLTHHAEEIAGIQLAHEDWTEIIDLDRWRRAARPVADGPIRIGRHGRDDEWKWPADRATLRAAFPPDPEFEVRVLGGADVARDRLGALPDNWTVWSFDAVAPQEFLASLDVFVNFPHPDMVEAFGRTTLEALAVGVPVVTDERFAALFGNAVITCRPTEVADTVRSLVADDDAYQRQVQAGWRLVQDRFSFDAHLRRLASLGVGVQPPQARQR